MLFPVYNIIFSDLAKKNSDNVLPINIASCYENYLEKVIETFNYILKDKNNLYNYFFISENNYTNYIEKEIDYGGHIIFDREGDRKWHQNKVSEKSIWKNKIYKGEYVPWCSIRTGFILSRKSMELIVKENTLNEIYPDLAIAKILKRNNIHPYHMCNFSFNL